MFRFLFILLPLFVAAQETIIDSFEHDGIEREYILYLPASYTGAEAFPLILNFHGYGSDATQQMLYSDLFARANENEFIIVHPNGTQDVAVGNAFWNVGWNPDDSVDDVGFVHELLDLLIANYNVKEEQVYSTGMSNGGFFSYLLACEMSDRIAAIASVTGAMNEPFASSCMPAVSVPVLEIHGTADATVPYEGNAGFFSTEAGVAHWVEQNNCDLEPEIFELEDIAPDDGSTVEHFVYRNCDQEVEVELYKVIGGGHTWPGANFDLPGIVTNQDFDASDEIWRFFSQFDINGAIGYVSGAEELHDDLQLYPNPVSNQLIVDLPEGFNGNIEIRNLLGEVLLIQGSREVVDVSACDSGMALLVLRSVNGEVLKTQKIRISH